MARVREFTEADRPALLDLLKIHGPTNVPKLAKLRGWYAAERLNVDTADTLKAWLGKQRKRK